MNFIFAWVLVSISNNYTLTYSPPLKTEQDCIVLKKIVTDRYHTVSERHTCVMLNVGVAK